MALVPCRFLKFLLFFLNSFYAWMSYFPKLFSHSRHLLLWWNTSSFCITNHSGHTCGFEPQQTQLYFIYFSNPYMICSSRGHGSHELQVKSVLYFFFGKRGRWRGFCLCVFTGQFCRKLPPLGRNLFFIVIIIITIIIVEQLVILSSSFSSSSS